MRRIVFSHGAGRFGAAAWPRQHALAGTYDCLFLKRTGFDEEKPPQETDFLADKNIVLDYLRDAEPTVLVGHSYGAIAVTMAALEAPEKIAGLALMEPATLSLTADLPATSMHRKLMQPLMDRRRSLSDEEYAQEFARLAFGASTPKRSTTASSRLAEARLRLQVPPWEAPLHVVPGVKTLVLTGGWEPMYEEVAQFFAETGAEHRVVEGAGHRPQDTDEGARLLADWIANL